MPNDEPQGIDPFDLSMAMVRAFETMNTPVPLWQPLRRPLTGPRPKPVAPPKPDAPDGMAAVWIREGGEYECPHMEIYKGRPEWSYDGVWAIIPKSEAQRLRKAISGARKAEDELRETYEDLKYRRGDG